MKELAMIISRGASWLLIAAMGVSFVILLTRYIFASAAPGVPFGSLVRRLIDGRPLMPGLPDEYSSASRQLRRRLRRNEWALHTQLRILGWVLCVALLSRLVIFASVLVGSWLNGSLTTFFHDFSVHWVRWDAIGYLELAQNGYAASRQEYLILFPLYPFLVRLISPLFLGSMAVAGTVLSNLFLVGSGWALFLLTRESLGETLARRCVQLLMFSPLSVFFSVPYAESLFLFLTLLSVLLARRHQMVGATVAGMLAAFTRLAGIFTVIPLFLEVLRYEHSIGLWPRHKVRWLQRMTMYTLLTILVGLGTAGYLFINWKVTGSPWTFITVQAEAWSQRLGSISNTLRYSMENAFQNDSLTWMLGVWLPQCLAIFAGVALLTALSPRMEPGDGVYAWVYMAATMAPTWLLTGPRMLASMYALYPMLAQATRRKYVYAGLLVASLLLMIVFSYMYAIVGNVL